MDLELSSSPASNLAGLVAAVCRLPVKDNAKALRAVVSGTVIQTLPAVLRAIARETNTFSLLGLTPLHQALVHEYVSIACSGLGCSDFPTELLGSLQSRLAERSFAASPCLSLADYSLYVRLYPFGATIVKDPQYGAVARWFDLVQQHATQCSPLFVVHPLPPQRTSIFSADFTNATDKTKAKKPNNQAGGPKVENVGSGKEVKESKVNQEVGDMAAKAVSAKQAKPQEEPAGKPSKQEKAPKPLPVAAANIRRLDVRVGKVCAAAPHPNADNCLVLAIDMGEATGQRQVVAGVAQFLSSDAILGKQVLVIVNLKDAEVKGIYSRGRCLVATALDGTKEMLEAPGAKIGESVMFGTVVPSLEREVSSKNFNKILKDLKTTENGTAEAEGHAFTTSGGTVTSSIKGGTIA